MIINNIIFDSEYKYNLLLWSRSSYLNYDYFCELNLKDELDQDYIFTYIKNKFTFAENNIKKLYPDFGNTWYIDFEVIK